jgi:rubredoxin
MSSTSGPFGERRDVAAEARLECRICWHVYDPEAGDPVWQVPPGTPFAELPAHWTCPNCAANKDGFLVIDDE